MKKKNSSSSLMNRIAMLGLCVIFLAHLFVFHTHLLDSKQPTRLHDNTCATNSCCTADEEDMQKNAPLCNTCCDCKLDLKTPDASLDTVSFISIEPFAPLAIPFFFFEENPILSTHVNPVFSDLVHDPLWGLRRSLECINIRC